MVSVLERLPSANDRILFLEHHGCVQEAMEAMIEEGRYNDAGNLLRKNGRFIEAAKFVQKKSFAAECLLSAAHCVQTHSSINERYELIEGPTERAMELFEDCNDKNGEAQCLLILSKLHEDVDYAESARELFHKVNNICGEVDACLALFAILKEDVSRVDVCDFPSVFLRGLDRLFGLILALNKPQNSVAELQRVEMCETYFGLFKGDKSDVRCAFVKSGCLFVSSVPYSQAEVKIDKVVFDVGIARWRISGYLCGLACKLAQNICQSVESNARFHGICRRPLVGLSCNPGHCELTHAPFSDDVFQKLFEALCHQMHVNALVQSFVYAIARFDPVGQLSQKLLTDGVRDFGACRQFYNLLFPKMGQHFSFLCKDHIRVLRRNGTIKERLSRYAEFLWMNTRENNRWQNSDRFIEVSRILQLVGQASKVAVLLSVEEKAFAGRSVVCDGMLPDKQHGGFRSLFRLFEDGKRIFHVYGDVVTSANIFIRRFIRLIAWRTSIPKPSLANTSSIFEHQMIACLALFARLFNEYEYPVCLPESYLNLIDLWDTVYGTDKYPSLYSIVEATATGLPSFKGIWQVQRLLEDMVQLVSGQVSRRFNLINSAFSLNAIDRVLSGESERILVLAMTMLCNYGRGIPPAPCARLIESLRGVTIHAFLPCRVQTALKVVHCAKNVKDVVFALQSFLSERNEGLFSVRWCNRRLLTAEVNAASFTQSFTTGPAPWNHQAAVGTTSEPPMDIYSPSEFQMPIGYLEEQRKERALETQREEAAVKIQRWFRHTRRATPKSSPRDEAQQEQPPVHSAEAHFEHFKADISACSVCSVHFSSGEDYESHIQSGSGHWRMLEEFNAYKQLYLRRIWPLFTAEKELRDELNALSGQNRLGSHDFGLDVQRLDHVGARVGDCIRDIESRCRWGDTGRLTREVEALGATIKQVQTIVKQGKEYSFRSQDRNINLISLMITIYFISPLVSLVLFVDLQKMRGAAGVMAERRDDLEENEEFGDEEDILDLRMPKENGAKRGGGGKQPGKKKNRGRRGRDKTRFRQS